MGLWNHLSFCIHMYLIRMCNRPLSGVYLWIRPFIPACVIKFLYSPIPRVIVITVVSLFSLRTIDILNFKHLDPFHWFIAAIILLMFRTCTFNAQDTRETQEYLGFLVVLWNRHTCKIISSFYKISGRTFPLFN